MTDHIFPAEESFLVFAEFIEPFDEWRILFGECLQLSDPDVPFAVHRGLVTARKRSLQREIIDLFTHLHAEIVNALLKPITIRKERKVAGPIVVLGRLKVQNGKLSFVERLACVSNVDKPSTVEARYFRVRLIGFVIDVRVRVSVNRLPISFAYLWVGISTPDVKRRDAMHYDLIVFHMAVLDLKNRTISDSVGHCVYYFIKM